ncbi:MAG: hypothetical protein M5U01_29835 [Ardenticatenaceae bacterium]|nr:hypothetical protein [Ardenticatenaceae bacterium]HBY96514.1 hypothetical protein [Chloroflexota bacterium]
MFGTKTPFLFPHESVPFLKDMRDESWAELVERIAELAETDEESLAFQLMMIRICGCLRCTNYKASLGCTVCSQRAVRNSKAPSGALLRWFAKAQEEVLAFLESQEPQDIEDEIDGDSETARSRKAA